MALAAQVASDGTTVNPNVWVWNQWDEADDWAVYEIRLNTMTDPSKDPPVCLASLAWDVILPTWLVTTGPPVFLDSTTALPRPDVWGAWNLTIRISRRYDNEYQLLRAPFRFICAQR